MQRSSSSVGSSAGSSSLIQCETLTDGVGGRGGIDTLTGVCRGYWRYFHYGHVLGFACAECGLLYLQQRAGLDSSHVLTSWMLQRSHLSRTVPPNHSTLFHAADYVHWNVSGTRL